MHLKNFVVAAPLAFLAFATAVQAAPLPPVFDDYRAAPRPPVEQTTALHGAAPVRPERTMRDLPNRPAIPLPPTFTDYAAVHKTKAPISSQTAQKPEQAELKQVLTRTLPVAQADVAKVSAAYRTDWQDLQKQVRKLDAKQKELADGEPTAPQTAAELQQVLHETQQKVEALRTKMRTPQTMASEPAQPKAAQNDEAAQLETLASELAYREALIAKLLENSHGSAENTALSASLLAIQNYPVASGSVAIFALAVLWLLRGRLAELSAFGLKMRFNSGKKSCKKDSDDAE